jgi:hypothetical protein
LVGSLEKNTQELEALLVNPDYSLTSYNSSAPLPSTGLYSPPSVDPTGSNLYLPGSIDSNNTPGVLIYPANGSLQSVGSIATPKVLFGSRMVFTPDGTLAFLGTCPMTTNGSILSYSRASNGMLTSVSVYALRAGSCVFVLAMSPDGKYLAQLGTQPEAQVFSIASDGTLSPATPPFMVTLDPQGTRVDLLDMMWDQSGSYLLVSTSDRGLAGGVAVLSFSGSTLTETVYPTEPFGVAHLQRTGSFVYGFQMFPDPNSVGIVGYDFQNGQLTHLPGSPYPYGNWIESMVIY